MKYSTTQGIPESDLPVKKPSGAAMIRYVDGDGKSYSGSLSGVIDPINDRLAVLEVSQGDGVPGIANYSDIASLFPSPDAGQQVDVLTDPDPENVGRWGYIGGAWVKSADRVTSLKNDVDALSLLPGPGITDIFHNPNIYNDPDLLKFSSMTGSDPDGNGVYARSASSSVSIVTLPSGRSYAELTSTGGTANVVWSQYIARVGIDNGSLISASVKIHAGGFADGGTKIHLMQVNSSGSEIVPARQTKVIPYGDTKESVVSWVGVGLDPDAVMVRMYWEVGGVTAALRVSEIMLAKGTVPDYRPAIAGNVNTSPSDKVAFVSPSGSDTTGKGTQARPFATAGKALSHLKGWGTIVFDGAEFGPEQQIDPAAVKGRLVLTGRRTSGAAPIIRMANKLAGITKTSGRTKVYQAPVSGLTTTPLWVYQDGVPDARTVIPEGSGRAAHNGRTHRLYCTKIVKATATTLSAALDEIDAATDPRCFYDSGVLYFTVDGGGNGSVANIYIDSAMGLFKAATLATAPEVVVSWLDLRYGETNTQPFRRTHFESVKMLGARSSVWMHSGVTTFNGVETSCGGSFSTTGVGDGIGGTSRAEITGWNAYSHDNWDDGESNHEYGRTRLWAALFEYNGGSAAAAAIGTDAIYYDCESFSNQRVAGRKPASFLATGAPGDGGTETRAEFVRCRSEGDAVSFADGGPGSTARATCVECVSINPTSMAYSVRKIKDCRHYGTGTQKSGSVVVENSNLVT